MGEIAVPEALYYGAQTERSRQNFAIGSEPMPKEVIEAILLVKKAAALANEKLNRLSSDKALLIVRAVDKLLKGGYDENFPLKVWQTGSGTHTNMNVNEVISNVAIEASGGVKGSKTPIHPNDDVNCSQSSNDVFPTAMHLAVLKAINMRLLPALRHFAQGLHNKALAFDSIIKVGRTHLMDATPLTLGQEFSGYAVAVDRAIEVIQGTCPHLCEIALGGTAVGTGINAPKDFDITVAAILANITNEPIVTASNKFDALASNDTMVEVSGALKLAASAFMKIANDIRLMGSGPRSGLGELILPANEPGSSIMPGKVNPTQAEAMTQVAVQVMGNDAAIGFAASLGNFELNVFKPVIIYNLLQSINLLADAAQSFTDKCLLGLKANEKKIQEHLDRSLMLATALNRRLGYDKAAEIVKKAWMEDLTLKDAALKLHLLTEAEFDDIVDPAKLI